MSKVGSLQCRGVIVPVITPVTANGSLDESAFGKVIEHVVAGGVHGVFVLGTMGEGPSLSHSAREAAVRIAVRTVAGRVPVYVGITHPSLTETLADAQRFRQTGADFLVAVCPYYYPLTAGEILDYFETLADAVESPLLLYDIPGMTKVTIPHDVIEKLSRHERIVGYKDSRNNVPALMELLQRMKGRDDFAVLVGVEELMADTVLTGGAGGVCGGGNVWPELFVDIFEAARARNLDALEPLRRRLAEFVPIYSLGDGVSAMIAGIKAALECLGLCQRYLLPPLRSLDDRQVESARVLLKRLGRLE